MRKSMSNCRSSVIVVECVLGWLCGWVGIREQREGILFFWMAYKMVVVVVVVVVMVVVEVIRTLSYKNNFSHFTLTQTHQCVCVCVCGRVGRMHGMGSARERAREPAP